MDPLLVAKWFDEVLNPYFKLIKEKCTTGTKQVKDINGTLRKVTGPMLDGKLNGWCKYTIGVD